MHTVVVHYTNDGSAIKEKAKGTRLVTSMGAPQQLEQAYMHGRRMHEKKDQCLRNMSITKGRIPSSENHTEAANHGNGPTHVVGPP
jgi:hypothetical protein